MEQFFVENSEIILRLIVATGLGLIIGVERLLVKQAAGMKTHALVSMGSAVFVLISEAVVQKYMNVPGLNPTMMAAQIIVGIGFLGAGSIILQGSRLVGLTTAGGLWVTAGIGMAAGFGLFNLVLVAGFLVLFVFIVISVVERPIRKISGEDNQS